MLSEAPEGWNCCHLGEAVQIEWGDTSVTKKSFTQTGFTAYSAAGGDGCLPYFDFEGMGVVVSAIGANSGRVFLADGKWSAIKNTMVVFPKEDISNIEFFYYLAQQREFWVISGGAQPFIGLKNAKKQLIQLPPLNEQHRIAEILASVDTSIQATQAVIEQAERVKRGLMEELLTGGLGSEAIERGEVPEGWEIKALQEVSVMERGKFSARPRNDPKYYGGKYPFIQTGDVANARKFVYSYSQTLNDEGLRVSKLFSAGTLMMSIAANVGNVALVTFDTAAPDSVISITPNEHKTEEFFYYLLSNVKEQLEAIATQNAQANLNLDKLNKFKVLMPPKTKWAGIVNVLAGFDVYITSQKGIVEQQTRTKRGLMDDLLTGKVRTV